VAPSEPGAALLGVDFHHSEIVAWPADRDPGAAEVAAPPTYSLRLVQFAWKFGVVMLIALALVVLPGGGNALDAVLTLLTVAFFAAIAFLVYRFYGQYRMDLESLDSSLRLGLYGSLALAILTFTATDRLFDAGGGGVLLWFGLLALASYGLFWVWTRYRRYE
jgi:hypothetical protein